MWLVPKGAHSAKGRAALDPALAQTLRIWYAGQGDHRDEAAAVQLLRHARKNSFWIACNCQSQDAAPMLAPALLSGADTYYLRRTTGQSRTQHSISCIFFREQSVATITSGRRPARNQPEGFFALLRPPALSLAQQPDNAIMPRDSASHGAPRLAKLLWRLLELSGRTVIAAGDDAHRDITHEFAAIRKLADQIEVAPGIALSRVLSTHPKDWETRRIFAVLRERAKNWPKGHEPQAFLLVFARKVHEHSLETSEGLIELATRLRHPGTRQNPIDGPDLTLVAIGERGDGAGYGALRAWAQPVYNGHRFIPVDSNFDRDIVEALIAAQRILGQNDILLSAQKPLFDRITQGGPVRPAWLVTLNRGDRKRLGIIETPATSPESGTPETRRRRALDFIAPIIDVNENDLSMLTHKLQALWHSATIPDPVAQRG